MLHVIPEKELNSLADWEKFLGNPGVQIEDDEGDDYSLEQLLKVITVRSFEGVWKVPCCYETLDEYLGVNRAEYGPNGLLRASVGREVVGQGEGTWDLVKGYFR